MEELYYDGSFDIKVGFSHTMKQKQTREKRDERDPKKLDEVLDHYHFRHLIKRSQTIREMNQQLPQWLPADIAPYCRVMNIEEDRLALEVNNAAIATRLRFTQNDLLAALRFHDRWRWIKRITIHVRNNTQTDSKHTNKVLQETIKSVKNPQLKAVLDRMSKK